MSNLFEQQFQINDTSRVLGIKELSSVPAGAKNPGGNEFYALVSLSGATFDDTSKAKKEIATQAKKYLAQVGLEVLSWLEFFRKNETSAVKVYARYALVKRNRQDSDTVNV